MMKKIGVYGGTFDPPHIGHLILAEQACNQLGLDQVLWVLTPHPPNKMGDKLSAKEDRLSMIKVCVSDNPRFNISYVDLNRHVPHYAIDTMTLLHYRYPSAKLVYLLGEDSLFDLPNWHKVELFIQACDQIGVMRRDRINRSLSNLEGQLPGILDKVSILSTPLIQLSSSAIRERIIRGESYRYFLLPRVYKIVQKKKLYLEDVIS